MGDIAGFDTLTVIVASSSLDTFKSVPFLRTLPLDQMENGLNYLSRFPESMQGGCGVFYLDEGGWRRGDGCIIMMRVDRSVCCRHSGAAMAARRGRGGGVISNISNFTI